MKEDFLHYVWQHKLFVSSCLKTTSKESISIVHAGIHNKNAGPDFLNAKLKIDNQLWVGNIEIHVKSSDWYAHHHENDTNYDAVMLHVVWEYDAVVFMKDNQPLPTLVLKEIVSKNVFNNYNNLLTRNKYWIPCESKIKSVNPFLLKKWQERLYFERLERKSLLINQLLKHTNNDYEAVLFQLLAKNFGLKVNGDAFLSMAKSFNFSILRKIRFEEEVLTALLYGQAGFLEARIEDSYYQNLQKEYTYLQYKYQLTPIPKNHFSFFRMRPTNFPTIRMAQLVALYHQHENLFSKIIKTQKLIEIYKLFSVPITTFWQTHYTFEKSSKKSLKKITRSFVDLLIINTIIPLKFLYQKRRGEVRENELVSLIKQIQPEKNTIISGFSNLQIKSENAFDTQALLELKNEYCTSKRCVVCVIGNQLLRDYTN